MKLIIDAPDDKISEATIVIQHHLHISKTVGFGQRNAEIYGASFGGVYKTTWAVWRTKHGFSMRYLGEGQ